MKPSTVILRASHEFMNWVDCQQCVEQDGDECTPNGCDAQVDLHWYRWGDPESPNRLWTWDYDESDPERLDDDEPIEVELPIARAAVLMSNWPHGISSVSESEYSTIDYGTGLQHTATLFVDGDEAAVAAAIDIALRLGVNGYVCNQR